MVTTGNLAEEALAFNHSDETFYHFELDEQSEEVDPIRCWECNIDFDDEEDLYQHLHIHIKQPNLILQRVQLPPLKLTLNRNGNNFEIVSSPTGSCSSSKHSPLYYSPSNLAENDNDNNTETTVTTDIVQQNQNGYQYEEKDNGEGYIQNEEQISDETATTTVTESLSPSATEQTEKTISEEKNEEEETDFQTDFGNGEGDSTATDDDGTNRKTIEDIENSETSDYGSIPGTEPTPPPLSEPDYPKIRIKTTGLLQEPLTITEITEDNHTDNTTNHKDLWDSPMEDPLKLPGTDDTNLMSLFNNNERAKDLGFTTSDSEFISLDRLEERNRNALQLYNPSVNQNSLSSLTGLPMEALAQQVSRLQPSGNGMHQQNVLINIQQFPQAPAPHPPPPPPYQPPQMYHHPHPPQSMYHQPYHQYQPPNPMYYPPGPGYPQPMPPPPPQPQMSMGQHQMRQPPMSQPSMVPSSLGQPQTSQSQNMNQNQQFRQQSLPQRQQQQQQQQPPQQQQQPPQPQRQMAPSQRMQIQPRQPLNPRQPIPQQRARGVTPATIRPRPPGMTALRGTTIRPRMPMSQNGQVNINKIPANAVKRTPEPNQGAQQLKRRRFDVLTPDKDDDDCQVICMQPNNKDGGLPQIQSVQGGTCEPSESNVMHLSDSITLSVRNPQPRPQSPKKSDAKAVANILATRGITVTATPKAKEKSDQKANGGISLPSSLNLNGAVSIIPSTKSTNNGNNNTNQTSEKGSTNNSESNLPTVDLTEEVITSVAPGPQKSTTTPPGSKPAQRSGNLPFRCDLCSAQYPNSLGLSKHRQNYHRTGSNQLDIGIPLINLKQPGIFQKMASLGIYNYIPLPSSNADGTFALPIINSRSGNAAGLGANTMLTLGPIRYIPKPQQNGNVVTNANKLGSQK